MHCCHGSLGFPQRCFLLQISSLPFPQSISQGQQQSLPQDCSPIPMLLIPETVCTVGYTSQSKALELQHGLYVCFSLYPIIDFLLYLSPTASNCSLLCQPISLSVRGLPQVWKSLLCFSSSTPGCSSSPASFPPPSPFFSTSFLPPSLSFVLPSHEFLYSFVVTKVFC